MLKSKEEVSLAIERIYNLVPDEDLTEYYHVKNIIDNLLALSDTAVAAVCIAALQQQLKHAYRENLDV